MITFKEKKNVFVKKASIYIYIYQSRIRIKTMRFFYEAWNVKNYLIVAKGIKIKGRTF